MNDTFSAVCIVLNYNDADTTIEQLSRIRGYGCFDAVIVVDNHSTDDSFVRLKDCTAGHVIFLEAGRNGGYGAGNNLGLKYAREILHAKYALIANPDAEFTEECVVQMLYVMERHPELGILAPVKTTPDMGEAVCIPGTRENVLNGAAAWPVRPWLYDLLESGPISRRIFTKILHYPEKYYRGKTCVYAGAVPGALLLTDIDKMFSAGLYDENVFLYGEEYMLAWKMKACGYRTALLLRESYVHRHSLTIRKTFKNILKRQKMREESTLHYYREYLKANGFQIFLTRIFYFFVNLEDFLFFRSEPEGREN